MRKIFTFVFTVFLTVSLFSQTTFLADGVKYSVLDATELTAEVTYRGPTAGDIPSNYRGNILIPASVTDPGTSITYSVIAIGNTAFHGDTVHVTLSEGLTEIKKEAFKYARIPSIVFPYNLMTLGTSAFAYVKGITSITLPENLTNVPNGAFSSGSFTEILADEWNIAFKSVDGVLFNNSGTKLIAYPAGNTRGFYAVPTGTITIMTASFSNSKNLHTLLLPSTITGIENWAFTFVTNLTIFACDRTTPPALYGSAIFLYAVDLSEVELQVAIGGAEAFRAATTWKDFGSIIEVETFPTAVNNVEYADVRVWGTNKAIRINTEHSRELQIKVYNIFGQTVHQSILKNSETSIELPKGLYVVKINDKSYKVIVN